MNYSANSTLGSHSTFDGIFMGVNFQSKFYLMGCRIYGERESKLKNLSREKYNFATLQMASTIWTKLKISLAATFAHPFPYVWRQGQTNDKKKALTKWFESNVAIMVVEPSWRDIRYECQIVVVSIAWEDLSWSGGSFGGSHNRKWRLKCFCFVSPSFEFWTKANSFKWKRKLEMTAAKFVTLHHVACCCSPIYTSR